MTELEAIEQFKGKTAEILSRSETDLDALVDVLQSDLFTKVMGSFLGKLRFDDENKLTLTARNTAALGQLENLFDSFAKSDIAQVVKKFFDKLKSVAAFVGTYYEATGHPERIVNGIAADNAEVYAILGVDERGKAITGGYLDRLARSEQVKTQLVQVVSNAISTKQSLQDFTNSLQTAITGNNQVDGFLKRYFRQYANDSFAQIREVKNEQFATALKLKYFLYQGSAIDTTRLFCLYKIGKVFSTEQAIKEWPRDPNLIGKNRPEPYDPLRDRGRWRCRHWKDYISDELAQELLNKQT